MEQELTYLEKIKKMTAQGRINALKTYKQEMYSSIEKQATLGKNWIEIFIPGYIYYSPHENGEILQEFMDQGFNVKYNGTSCSKHSYIISW